MTARMTVRLPGDLMRRAKRKAETEGRTLKDVIEEGLRRVLDDASPPTRADGWRQEAERLTTDELKARLARREPTEPYPAPEDAIRDERDLS